MTSTISRRIAGLAVAIFGICWLPGGISETYGGIASKGWPQTEAKLIQAEVRPGYRGRSRPMVTYHYFVREAQHTGEVIAFGDEWPSATSQVDNLRNERPLLAYYDPDDPGRAILHPGVTFGAMYRLFVSLVAILGGVFNLFRPPR